MPNILIRDLSQQAVDRIDAAAANLGYRAMSTCAASSRKTSARPAAGGMSPAEDWQRSAEVFADLADPTVMEAAWR